MKDNEHKDEIQLLGEFLSERAPSSEEERSALGRSWQEMRTQDFRPVAERPSLVRYVWAVGVAAVVITVVTLGVLRRSASPAIITNAAGSMERVYAKGTEAVRAGEKIAFGEVVRSGSQSRSVLTLNDGSQIEMRANSALALEKAADGLRIRLDKGGVFITAAKQRNGRLYVQTKDVVVSVVGTVFLVNVEEAGSRVAVVEGEVRVQQGDKTSRLLPGEQVSTNPLMAPHPVVEQLAWSTSAEPYLAPLQQPKRLEFEGAVLRPLPRVGERYLGPPRCRGVDGALALDLPTAPQVPLGRCVSDRALLRQLLETAYDIEGTRISGLPPIVQQPEYQFEAKAEDPTKTTKEDLRVMLQNFVIDQFKLKVHRETRQMDGYVLTIGKSGVKFSETAGEEVMPRWGQSGPPGTNLSGRTLPMTAKGKFRIQTFANSLASFSHIPIIDKTGLQGLYDLSLSIDVVFQGVRFGALPADGGPQPPQEFDPPLPKAIEEQLGLHLERGKVPVEYLVVDHYEPAN